ncbi:glycosyltransferase family 4 protein [Zunongwangia sp.]|uniref:glycosyltransferase family 4 protein n=1 Tax=Zunongwangia sp. TaxID=1965325 RepID=UPI003AA9417F
MLREEGYSVQTASGKENKVLRLSEMLGLIINNYKTTDIVLIDTYGATNFYYAYTVAKLCQYFSIPYVPILHGGNLPDRLKNSAKFSANLFGNAYMNIAPSKFLYQEFKNRDFTNLMIIPNSINLNKFPYFKRENFKPKLLWVRRFQDRYNPKMALKVIEDLMRKFPDASLCMVGPEKDGTMAVCKNYAIKYNLNVTFTGKLKKRAWAELSKEYDFFINTTTVDNTPLSVIESMALGLPVISTDVGGMPKLILNNKDGILVNNGDVNAMVKAVETLIQYPKIAQKISETAREKAESFSWETIKNCWINFLESID